MGFQDPRGVAKTPGRFDMEKEGGSCSRREMGVWPWEYWPLRMNGRVCSNDCECPCTLACNELTARLRERERERESNNIIF